MGRVWRIIWITFPVLLFSLRTKQTGLFLGWFYLDPLLDYGVLVLRLVNFSVAFWMLQSFWYFPASRYGQWLYVRVFWRSFGLVLDMWQEVLFWPKQRFSLWKWINERYESLGNEKQSAHRQVFSQNIDNLSEGPKE
ncbi:hypothetical protein [Thermospira aquatica]|uniref:Uncharacterized protein n=1 Tax=Thermospira aquatica TaxID=2828656 RepID=A0AAX3B9Y8_9SPIR|nr:hypothetical protein [Thermospira aquatica]URA09065.1 hypothetical protein KDW03_06035 [Thermospira aquatica]